MVRGKSIDAGGMDAGKSMGAGLSTLELDRLNRIRSNRMMMEQVNGVTSRIVCLEMWRENAPTSFITSPNHICRSWDSKMQSMRYQDIRLNHQSPRSQGRRQGRGGTMVMRTMHLSRSQSLSLNAVLPVTSREYHTKRTTTMATYLACTVEVDQGALGK